MQISNKSPKYIYLTVPERNEKFEVVWELDLKSKHENCLKTSSTEITLET